MVRALIPLSIEYTDPASALPVANVTVLHPSSAKPSTNLVKAISMILEVGLPYLMLQLLISIPA